jgi:hypothetical protein
MTILRQQSPSIPTTMPKSPTPPKPPSPTNVSNLPIEGWMSTTRPTKCVVTGRIGNIIGYEDYYSKNESVLCTRVFSVTAIATTINDGASPPGSTKLDDKTGHNCKMSRELYKSFTLLVLGIDHNSCRPTLAPKAHSTT